MPPTEKTRDRNDQGQGAAAAEQEAQLNAGNDTIAHTDEAAPRTTRSDATDLGVPMAPVDGDPARYTHPGPEDALGDAPTRGDYSGRLVNGPTVRMRPVTDRSVEERSSDVQAADGTTITARARELGPNVEADVQVPSVKPGG